MNTPKQILIALFLTVIIIGCRRNEVIHPDTLPEQFTATLTGRIFNANSTPLSNATVKLGSRTVATDDSGYFRFDNAILNRNNTVVSVEKPGYFKAVKTFNASREENRVELRLLYKNLIGSFESVNGGTVSLSNGSKIEIPADGVNKASGGIYTGTVKVYAEYIDPASNILSSLMPGSMLGTDKSGRKIIVSPLGILSVVLESADGELLKLAKGKKATLTTLISQSLQASAPGTASMAYLDEETGLWQEEGTATKQGNTYVGTVSHFSYWLGGYNSFPVINFSVRYVNPAGGPMIGYEANAYYTNGNSAGWGYTGVNGEIDGYLPANTPLTLVLKDHYPCYTPIHSVNLPASATNLSLGTIVVNPPTSKTLKGRLLDCNGNPVTTGYVLVWHDNVRTGTPVNQAGEFSILMSPCAGPITECKILGIDSVGDKQTTLISVSLNQPVTDAGNITVCGLAAEQFVKYRKNNWQWEHIINSYNYDWSRSGKYIQGGSNSSMAQIRGVTAWGLIGVDFEFTHNNTTGVYPITRLLEMENSPPYELIPPFNVTLTKFPLQAGDFYEGSFQGNCRHQNTGNQVHFFECSFRVRKMNL